MLITLKKMIKFFLIRYYLDNIGYLLKSLYHTNHPSTYEMNNTLVLLIRLVEADQTEQMITDSLVLDTPLNIP